MKESSRAFLEKTIPSLRSIVTANIDDLFEDSLDLAFEEHNAIVDLYTVYTSYEIDSFDKIVSGTNEFFTFLIESKPYKTDRLVRDSINRAMRIITRHINRFSYENLGNKFAQAALNLSPTNPQFSHILDVGPGYVPYSSLVLATETKDVSAMDKDFLFSTTSLKNMNVNASLAYFGKNTPIDDYDFVIGSCPCSAIPYIVAKCKLANKPYFLQLCDCAIYDKRVSILDSFAAKGKYKWSDILPELDPDIKFYDDYAFNLGASPAQVKRVISRIYGSSSTGKLPIISADQLIFDPTDPNVSISSMDFNSSAWSKE